MKKINKIIVSILFVFLLFICVGCKTPTYNIILQLEDGSEYKTLVIEEGQTLTLDQLEKEGHTFDGWYEGGVKVENNAVVNKNMTLIAKFTINSYTYKFIVDGEIIKEVTGVYGDKIEYPLDPEKESTVELSYEFIGWDNDATTLLEDEVFNAKFSDSKNLYIYQFIDWNGKVLKEETVEYGTMPVAPADPVREESGKYTYEFIGWDQEITEVTGNVIYNAVYEEVEKPLYSKYDSLDGLKVSILGDSISTFYKEGSPMNSLYGGTNQFYYPIYSSTIKTVDLTWWYQLLENTNLELGVNNSWSGSCAVGTGESAGNSDARINTLDDNGNPDIVLVYLGTNDCAGAYDLNSYKEAIITIIEKIRNQGTPQIYLTTLGYTAYKGNKYKEENRLAYNSALREIAKNYDCGIVALDDYIINDNYMIYLGDNLHYNAKGAKLLSKIYEKAIKDFNNIEFNEEIEVEHKELLPEGVLGKTTATADKGFWEGTNYASNVYFSTASAATKATYSTSYEIKKDATTGKYYVSEINKSGTVATYDCDYVLLISDAHTKKSEILADLKDVVVGAIVEFNEPIAFPLELTFKVSDGSTETPKPEEKPDEDLVEGELNIGAYNTGVWTLYETTVMAYSNDTIDKNSTFVNFNIIKLTKTEEANQYKITGLKPVGENAEFSDCDYYILIFSSLEAKSYYENAKLDQVVIINGDITSGKCSIKFN